MTSWVISIDKSVPQHWNNAQAAGFWDMTSRQQIDIGDLVYFRISGGPFVGQVEATSSVYPISEGFPDPWEDSGERDYKVRFDFRTIASHAKQDYLWADVRTKLTKDVPLTGPKAFRDQADEEVLASLFESRVVILDDPQQVDSLEGQLQRLLEDNRQFALRQIALRQGQRAFRDKLLVAYEGRCAVTGTALESVLEAAHIAPYKGAPTHQLQNGLLLRADIHTLFDLARLTVTPDWVVRVKKGLPEPYADLDGQALRLPADANGRPSPAVLEKHNSLCPWLSNRTGSTVGAR